MIKYTFCAAALGLLLGCTTTPETSFAPTPSSSAGIPPAPAPQSFAASSSDTLTARVNGTEPTFFTSKVPLFSFGSGSSVALDGAEEVTIEITPNGDGTISVTMTAFGQTVTFTEDDLTAPVSNTYRKFLASGLETFSLVTLERDFDAFLDGALVHQFATPFIAVYVNSITGERVGGFGLGGLQTAPDAMPRSGRARYLGSVTGDSYLSNDVSQFLGLNGRVVINANFDTGRVSGKFDQLSIGGASQPDIFRIEDTAIVEQTYVSTLTADPAGCTGSCFALNASTVEGAFFGNAAQETGGIFTIDGTTPSGSEFDMQGFFIGEAE